MRKKFFVLVAMVAVLSLTLAMVSQARATTVTYNVTFDAEFTSNPDWPPTVTGSFTVTLDPALIYPPATQSGLVSGLVINPGAPTLPLDLSNPQVAFSSVTNQFIVGVPTATSPPTSNPPNWVWSLAIDNFATSSPTFTQFCYITNESIEFCAVDESVSAGLTGTVTPVSAIPAPPALLLFGTGLIPLAWFRRRNLFGE